MRNIRRGKLFYWVYIFLIGAILVFDYWNTSDFEMICSLCAALFWFIQLRLVFLLDSDNETQRKQGKPVGFLLLLPAMGIIAAGVMLLLRSDLGLSNGWAIMPFYCRLFYLCV